jgi:hypothetical protein
MRQMKSRSTLIEKYIEPSKIEKNEVWICKTWFNRNDDLHSFMGQPSVIYYDKNGQVMEQYWNKKGKLHRDKNLPAYVEYYNGQILEQQWYKNGEYIKSS